MIKSPAEVKRRAHTLIPETDGREGSSEGRSVDSGEEDRNTGSQGDRQGTENKGQGTDRGPQRPRTPRSSPPISEREFRGPILQESVKDRVDHSTSEDPDGEKEWRKEDRDIGERRGEKTTGVHAPPKIADRSAGRGPEAG